MRDPESHDSAAVARDVLDSLHEGCQVVSREFRYVYVNAAAAAQGKRTPGSLLGRTMMECYPGIDETPMFAQLRRTMSDRAHGRMDNEFTFPDGQLGWFELVFVPVDAGVCILSIDVTTQRRASIALKESEAALRTLFAANPDATLLTAEGGTVLLANNAAARLFGRDAGALAGERVEVLLRAPTGLPPVDDDFGADGSTAASDFDGIPRPRESSMRELRGRRADGTEMPVDVSLGPLEFFGRPASLAVIRDLTERRRLELSLRRVEEQARQMQKMEAVSRLAGGIAHDFNNVLSIILSYATLVGDSLGDDDERTADVRQIEIAAKRASELTSQLLAFSRQQVATPRPVVLDACLGGMEKMLRRLLGADIEMTMKPRSAPCLVKVDPGQIEQVLMNLAVNARDAMPKGGKLTIETDTVDLDEVFVAEHLGTRPGKHVMLAVSDTGHGMNAATRARIFEPFYTTKEVGRGTGLGLSTVFGIVQQSGGSIWVYSEPNVGTTFKIYFPLSEGSPEPATPDPRGPRPLRGSEVILLAENEPQLRQLVASLLERAGYRVLVSASPTEALDLAAAHEGTIDLLLTDLVMPKMNGRELARRITETRRKTRVLFISGYTGTAAQQTGEVDEGAAFLQKPITPDALLSKVREVLSARRPEDSR